MRITALKDVYKRQVVEGYFATEAVHFLSKDSGSEMPISEAMYRLLFEGEKLETVVAGLIAREGKPEFWGEKTDK